MHLGSEKLHDNVTLTGIETAITSHACDDWQIDDVNWFKRVQLFLMNLEYVLIVPV